MPDELTRAQMDKQDEVDNACYELICNLSPNTTRDPKTMESTLSWDIYLITKVREAVEEVICDDLKLMSHMAFYPWIEIDKIKCPCQFKGTSFEGVVCPICKIRKALNMGIMNRESEQIDREGRP